MASVIVYPPDLGAPQIVPLERRIVRFGTAPDNDVPLDGGDATPHHAHIVYERSGFTVAQTDPGAPLTVNGKRKRSQKLTDGDLIDLGGTWLRFVLYDQGLKVPAAERGQPPSAGGGEWFEALHRFSERLSSAGSLDELFGHLLDELIALTGAQRAFLLLALDGGTPRIQAARNVDRETLERDDVSVSDSIVRRVLDGGQPLIVADALSHDDFKTSRSVIDLRLCSVMCVPLKSRGATVGLFYLGNDNAVNQFDHELLEIVGVFGAQAATIIEGALSRHELAQHVEELERDVADRRFGEIIGACDAMRDVFKKVSRVASTDISVLIEGETGTGKELVARAIHQRSNRADGPFVVINCGAIPDTLLESELFGHVRGAFTGAVATHKGKFQSADGGTLFLDEIGEMPLSLQVKILRAIQEKVVTKVGGTKPEQVDIRIVAATNRHLADEVSEGRFREDLYYRLNVITLDLPPLRERDDDIVLIARYFLGRHADALVGHSVSLSSEAVAALKRWRWPGNIRELENRLKKGIVFCEGGVITPDDLDLGDGDLEPVVSLAEAREHWQRGYINKVLALNDGNRTKTARDLDVDPRTIFRHLERERGEG